MAAYVRRERKKAQDNQDINNTLARCETSQADRPRNGYRKPFRHHPPHIQEKAMEWLNVLLHRHKAKLEAKSGAAARGYYGALVAVATHMAMRDLGLIESLRTAGKRGIQKRRTNAMLATKAGLTDPRPDTIVVPVPLNCEVGQGNLEGI